MQHSRGRKGIDNLLIFNSWRRKIEKRTESCEGTQSNVLSLLFFFSVLKGYFFINSHFFIALPARSLIEAIVIFFYSFSLRRSVKPIYCIKADMQPCILLRGKTKPLILAIEQWPSPALQWKHGWRDNWYSTGINDTTILKGHFQVNTNQTVAFDLEQAVGSVKLVVTVNLFTASKIHIRFGQS